MRTLTVAVLLLATGILWGQQTSPLFESHCSGCHGAGAAGGPQGPSLVNNARIAEQSAEQTGAFLARGNPAAGMPAFSDLSDADRLSLARFLRRLNANTIVGLVGSGEPARLVNWGPPGPGDWLTYNGSDSGNRYSALRQIDTSNVGGLELRWVFPMTYFGIESTPLEADGTLYVTGPNEVFALDARTGNPLWRYSRPATSGLDGDSKLGTNRGVALLGDRIFFVTDNAHLLALDRANGQLVWEVRMAPDSPAPEHYHYGGTVAPLIADGKVIAGVAGADEGIRGFVAAYRPADGGLVWRRWTVPRKGEPGIETWTGPEPITGGGSTWLTGSYDAATNTLYWATGNPWPDGNDRNRPGDNLYTDCVLALNAATGEVLWHYQFTPHDLKDRDATEPNVLVDTTWRGGAAKLLLHADRNGFFYVLDRMNGKVLLAKPFLKRVDWAKSVGPDGRPAVVDPRGCPSDAANWDATAFSPATRLYYVVALEECIGKPTGYPEQTGQRYLRAIDIDTGEIAWEVPQPGAARAKTWTGVLATAGGLIFYGRPNGGFAAVDQKTGKTLWNFETNVHMKASPITFAVAGIQYVAVAAGPNILCFSLRTGR
ncbi:MAG: PQQ-binding-like beta-propeller repeat protein [Acidobacteriota bacterium]|nr:PQQ-binding-like beta-propeller repeat protein [Acidobacteriota bacterium]